MNYFAASLERTKSMPKITLILQRKSSPKSSELLVKQQVFLKIFFSVLSFQKHLVILFASRHCRFEAA